MGRGRWKITGWLGVAGLFAGGLALLFAAGEAKKSAELTPEAKQAIEAAFPKATLGAVEMESEGGVSVYEVKVTHEGKELEVAVSADGLICEVETALSMSDLPRNVADVMVEAFKGGTAKEIVKKEARAELRSGKLVKLDVPQMSYEAEFVTGGKMGEIGVAPDGKILESSLREARGAQDDERETGEDSD